MVKPTGTIAWSANTVSPGTPVFIVIREHIIPNQSVNDHIYLWVDPPANAFGVPDGSVPAADAEASDGMDDTSSSTGPGRLYLVAGAEANFDELRIGTTWADIVTPAVNSCTRAGISSDPTNQTVVAGIKATFDVNATGTSPALQWQVSTNSGTSWNNISGEIYTEYVTPNLTLADSGNQYRAIASVLCDNRQQRRLSPP